MHQRITRSGVLAAAVALLIVAPASAETITPIDEAQRGTAVTLEGTVERILDEDEFRLADATGRIDVYIGPNMVPANVGDRVTVRGIVDDGLTRDVYAREMVLPDGSVVTFDRRYD
ncbi:MAG: NirD/YgiW/YdeI family stress tolerance protein [Kiloniellales bacterium]